MVVYIKLAARQGRYIWWACCHNDLTHMLTNAQCRAAKPKEGIYRLNDYKGLYLEIKPNGIKAWRYRFKLNDKASWYGLGDYPSVTLGEAREKCDVARKLVREGINPVQNSQIERIKREQDSANTFRLYRRRKPYELQP